MINDLKAKVYDLIGAIEQRQAEIKQLQGMIQETNAQIIQAVEAEKQSLAKLAAEQKPAEGADGKPS